MRTRLPALALALTLTLAGCASGHDPLAGSGPTDGSVVVGSQAYFSNEIIAEIYAQALEHAGVKVHRHFSIGQRDAYMPALKSGEVTVLPEYTGNLLQYFDPDTTATEATEVARALDGALPEGLAALDVAEAADQDTYTVTKETAEKYGLVTIGDLTKLVAPVRLGGPAELEQRPYGPKGLAQAYGVDVEFHPTGDTTAQDLEAGTIDVANIFSADPRIDLDGLVTLKDDRHLFLASQVVPVVTTDRAAELAPILNRVSHVLHTKDLRDLNISSTQEQRSAGDIAKRWLDAHPEALG